MSLRVCLRCKRKREIRARGVCAGCYSTLHKRGVLHMWDPRNRRTWDFTEDYLFIKETYGGTQEQIAARMGISRNLLNQKLMARRKWGQL